MSYSKSACPVVSLACSFETLACVCLCVDRDPWLGVFHGSELILVFQYSPLILSPAEVALSNAFIQ